METSIVRTVLALVMFAGASWLDLRSRRVANRYWFPFITAAAVFVIGDLLSPPQGWLVAYGAAAAATALLYGMWHLGSFGGADAKGLMVVAWLAPFAVNGFFPPVLDMMVNATTLLFAMPILLGIWNLSHGRVVGPAMLLGTPMAIDAAEARFVWPMQRVKDGKTKWRYWHRPGEAIAPVYEALRNAGVTTVWTTPKIPFMVPLFVGLAVHLRYGNLLLPVLERWLAP